MIERHWQFRLLDDDHVDCASYYAMRATEVALAMNCRVIASSVVSVEKLGGNGRKIIGTALLENVSTWATPKPEPRGRNAHGRGR